jgi:hypothetical protein
LYFITPAGQIAAPYYFAIYFRYCRHFLQFRHYAIFFIFISFFFDGLSFSFLAAMIAHYATFALSQPGFRHAGCQLPHDSPPLFRCHIVFHAEAAI